MKRRNKRRFICMVMFALASVLGYSTQDRTSIATADETPLCTYVDGRLHAELNPVHPFPAQSSVQFEINDSSGAPRPLEIIPVVGDQTVSVVAKPLKAIPFAVSSVRCSLLSTFNKSVSLTPTVQCPPSSVVDNGIESTIDAIQLDGTDITIQASVHLVRAFTTVIDSFSGEKLYVKTNGTARIQQIPLKGASPQVLTITSPANGFTKMEIGTSDGPPAFICR